MYSLPTHIIMQKAYNMSSVSPEAYFDLWKRLKAGTEKDELFLLYSKHWYKGRTDKVCSWRTIICEMVSTTLHDNPLCPPKKSSTSELKAPQTLTKRPYYPRHALR